ncbi:MAG: histidinol-phosphate transaminase [Actinomycetota bacterium]
MDLPLTVRADLAEVEAYVSPQQPAKYRMNTNETPYPPPEALVDEVAEEIRKVALNRYPDRDAANLSAAIAEHVEWPTDGLWIANGSNEIFMHLFLGFGGAGRSCLLFEPTYTLHSLIPKIASTRVLQQQRAEDFTIGGDRAIDLIKAESPEIVIVCSPNNPTGMCEPRKTIERLLIATPGIVIVDEAYGEFAGSEKSVRPLLERHRNLVLVKTFSKAWRLAGVRIGYMMASPSLIGQLARVRLPYHLSAITQIVGVAAIRHALETLEMVQSITTERDRIGAALAELGLRAYSSDANFVLFEVDDAKGVWSRLLERDVLVRRYSGVPGLERCLRVTAGLPEETDAFIAALKESIDG